MESQPYYLLAPGPVAIPERYLNSLAWPMIHHRTPEFTNILNRVLSRLKPLFQTENPVLLLPSTGSGAMEAAIVNTLSPGDQILVIDGGKFGERWEKIAKAYQIQTVVHKVPWGESFKVSDVLNLIKAHPQIKAICTQACETSTAVENPIQALALEIKKQPQRILIVDAITAMVFSELKMDEWGLDVVVAGSQKAFMLPAGLAMIALSKKAWQFQLQSKCPKFYFNLKSELKANDKGQTFFSSLVAHIRTLDLVLEDFEKQGLDQVRRQAQKIQKAILAAAQEYHLKVYSTCPTVTALKVPDGINGEEIQQNLKVHHNVTIAGGQDQLAGKIFRIGHMGDITAKALKACFKGLFDELNAKGFKVTDSQLNHAERKIMESMRS